jgi:hypothetical protein
MFINNQKVTGKFFDFFFDKNVTLGFGTIWSYQQDGYRPLTDFG